MERIAVGEDFDRQCIIPSSTSPVSVDSPSESEVNHSSNISSMVDLELLLIAAIDAGDVDSAQSMIRQGACIDTTLDGQKTPLMNAIRHSNPKTALCLTEMLLLYGSDPSHCVAGQLPTHEAVRLSRPEILSLLMSFGASPDEMDHKEKTASDYVNPDTCHSVLRLLQGEKTGMKTKFSRYIISETGDTSHAHQQETESRVSDPTPDDNIGENKENEEQPSHVKDKNCFLQQMQDIFISDIHGTSDSPDHTAVCHAKQNRKEDDFDDISELLGILGTPSLAASSHTTLRRKPLTSKTVNTEAERRYSVPQESEPGAADTSTTANTDQFKTPIPASRTKSYMRPTKASSARQRLSVPHHQGSEQRANNSGTPLRARQGKRLHRSEVEQTVIGAASAHPTDPDRRKTAPAVRQTRLFVDSRLSCESDLSDFSPRRTSTLKSTVTPTVAKEEEPTSALHSSARSEVEGLAERVELSISQEYLLTDLATGETFIEHRFPSIMGVAVQDLALLESTCRDLSSNALDTLKNNNSSSQTSRTSSVQLIDDSVDSENRRAYLTKLKKLKMDLTVPSSDICTRYPEPLSSSVMSVSILTKDSPALWKLEQVMAEQFTFVDAATAQKINYLTRETICKTSFNYLLLDPRRSQNLPFKAFSYSDEELWRTFVASIFYIGKGTRSRPLHHLQDAADAEDRSGQLPVGNRQRKVRDNEEKIRRIREIWEAGCGVVTVQVYHNTIAVEAFTREAAMIDAIGLDNITNVRPGDYYGPAAGWSHSDRRRLGTFLLYRAFKIFLQEGERQIRPVDLRRRPQTASQKGLGCLEE